MGRRSNSRDRRDRDRERDRHAYRDHSRRRRRTPSTSSDDSDRDAQRRRRRRQQQDNHHYHVKGVLPTPPVAPSTSTSHPGGHRQRIASISSSEIEKMILTSPPQPYTIPAAAPRVQVPGNLPVEVTSFLDLFALFVSRGGPLFEEDVRNREKGNHFFSFLSRPWNDPMNLYYRWRLYSLLQEGSRQLLRWSCEPYQLEQGNDAVVWLPPPPIRNGVEHLSYLCDEVVRDFDIPLMQKIESVQRPSALWISRLVTNDEKFFTALTGQQLAAFKAMICTDTAWTEACSSSGEDNAPHCDKSDHEAAMITYDRLSRYQSKVLSAAYIAERTCTVVEKGEAGTHALSVILDELVRLTAAVCGTCESARWCLHDPTVDCGPMTTDEMHRCWNGAEVHVTRWLLGMLSCLFQLHDICRNAGAAPVTVDDLVEAGEEGAASLTLPGSTPSLSNANAAKGYLVKALEWALPSILECVTRVTVAVPAAGSTTKQADGMSIDNGLQITAGGNMGDPILDDHDVFHASVNATATLTAPQIAAVIHSTRDPAGAAAASATDRLMKTSGTLRLSAFLVASWARTLIVEWGDAGLIGTRCWLKLQSTYGYFLSKQIEDTSA